MEQTNKRKSKVAVLLVHERKNGTIRQYQINPGLIEILLFIIFILGVAAVCQMVYGSKLLSDQRNEVAVNLVTIEQLTANNESLQKEKDVLSEKVLVLSETVMTKAATEEIAAEAAGQISLPKGFPLSGSASMEEAAEDNNTLVFHAAEGNTVVTAGSGIVEIIEPDEQYGTKIVLDHQNGYKSMYFNQGSPLVKAGDNLGKGYILFLIGEENKDLAYQIIKDDANINPMDIIEING